MYNNFTTVTFCGSKITGAKITLILCILVHVIVFNCTWLAYITAKPIPIIWSVYIGFAYILYPICGWIADVLVSHYNIIKFSLVFLIISSFGGFCAGVISIVLPNLFENRNVWFMLTLLCCRHNWTWHVCNSVWFRSNARSQLRSIELLYTLVFLVHTCRTSSCILHCNWSSDLWDIMYNCCD